MLQPPFPANRGKDTLYEGGIHVPFLIAGPAVAHPGSTNDTLVHAVDVFSTILELAAIDVAATVPSGVIVDSRSLVPLLGGNRDAARRAYSEKFGSETPTPDARMLRDDRYKLIRFASGNDEFYDLQTDPYEQINLLAGALAVDQQPFCDRLVFQLAGYSTNKGPRIVSQAWNQGQFSVSVPQAAGATFVLWRCDDVSAAFWAPITNAVSVTNESIVTLTDPATTPSRGFYSVVQGP